MTTGISLADIEPENGDITASVMHAVSNIPNTTFILRF